MKITNSLLVSLGLIAFHESTALPFPADTGAEMSANGQKLSKLKSETWARLKANPTKRSSVRQQEALCVDGAAVVNGESFPCEGIDFLSYISLADSNINGGTSSGSDIWGWLSPSGREITLWCVDNGMWFIDSTDPVNPQQLGFLASGRPTAGWADVKVHKDTAYIVKDGANVAGHGIEVFDLNRLEGLTADATRSFEPDFVYQGHGKSHNLEMNTESEFLYSLGTATCGGGLHMIDVSSPLEPAFAGCAETDGYTHDAQCLIYDGPDANFQGAEICFAFNEDTLTIWDVSVKETPVMVSRLGYGTAAYTHQGWATPDLKHVLLNDELDEVNGLQPNTNTYIVNVEDLANPRFVGDFVHEEVSVDHNLYFWGPIHSKGQGGNPPMETGFTPNYAYLSNYVSGLKVLDATDINNVTQVGYFDVAPDLEGNIFEGTWSNYLHPSGAIAVSSIDRGLFFLRPNMAFDEPAGEDTDPVLYAALALAVVAVVLLSLALMVAMKGKPAASEDEQEVEVKGEPIEAK